MLLLSNSLGADKAVASCQPNKHAALTRGLRTGGEQGANVEAGYILPSAKYVPGWHAGYQRGGHVLAHGCAPCGGDGDWWLKAGHALTQGTHGTVIVPYLGRMRLRNIGLQPCHEPVSVRRW